MERRQFLTASLAASALAVAGEGAAKAQPASTREYYQLRRYSLKSGQQLRLTEHYFAEALIPALGRMGMGPVGAFKLDYGEETPAYFLLIPGTDLAAQAELDLRLAEDDAFMKAAAPLWDTTSQAPGFQRVESWLLKAFAGWPKLTPPAKGKRIFQLRTYESPSYKDHVRKVEMFNSGEFDIFVKAGCHPVFFSDVLIGSHMPCLKYMLSFEDMNALEAGWDKFRTAPAWQKLTHDQRFAFDSIVTNISNITMSPLSCSQI